MITNAHLDFLKKGARMIITSSYQCYQAGFPVDKPTQKMTVKKKKVVEVTEEVKDINYGSYDPPQYRTYEKVSDIFELTY